MFRRGRDSEQAIGDKIEQTAAPFGHALRSAIPFLRSMLSIDPATPRSTAMDPKLRRAGMFDAVRQLLLASAEVRPRIVVLEDVHWMDQATAEFLARVAESLVSGRILLCVTHRTGFSLPFGEGVFQTRLTMSRLSQAETTALAGALLGVPVVSADLQRLLDAKTEGNPFFVEEIVRSLQRARGSRAAERRDRPCARHGDDGRPRHRAGRHPGAARAPRPVGARPASPRVGDRPRILAPCTERVVPDADTGPSIDDRLNALKAAELIHEGRVWPEVAYVFRHALTQEVAYHAQREPQRQALHGRIGDAIEQVYGDRLSEHFGVLAYHFTRARQWVKALDHLLAAARQAERSFATREALALYDEAKAVAEQLAGGVGAPATLIAIHEAKARLHFVMSDFDRSAAEAARILPFARLTDDRVKEGEALATIAWASTWGRKLDAALRFAHDALAVAEPAGAVAVQGRAHFTIGWVHGVTGVLDESHAALDKAMTLCRAAGDAVHHSLSLSTAGLLRNWRAISMRPPACRTMGSRSRAIVGCSFHCSSTVSCAVSP